MCKGSCLESLIQKSSNYSNYGASRWSEQHVFLIFRQNFCTERGESTVGQPSLHRPVLQIWKSSDFKIKQWCVKFSYIGMNFQPHSSHPQNLCCRTRSTIEINLLNGLANLQLFFTLLEKITAPTAAVWFRIKNVECCVHLHRKSEHCLSPQFNNLQQIVLPAL